jgi:predicted nucleotidyltransferase
VQKAEEVPALELDLLARDPMLAEIVARLVSALHPERVYLFGSQAKGDAGPESDYGLLVVVPDDALPERRNGVPAYRAPKGTRTAADVLVCTHTYFQARRHLRARLREGEVDAIIPFRPPI